MFTTEIIKMKVREWYPLVSLTELEISEIENLIHPIPWQFQNVETLRGLVDDFLKFRTSTKQDEIKAAALALFNEAIEDVFCKLHEQFKTAGGDIFPLQQCKLDDLEQDLADLAAVQVLQNLPEFSEIDS